MTMSMKQVQNAENRASQRPSIGRLISGIDCGLKQGLRCFDLSISEHYASDSWQTVGMSWAADRIVELYSRVGWKVTKHSGWFYDSVSFQIGTTKSPMSENELEAGEANSYIEQIRRGLLLGIRVFEDEMLCHISKNQKEMVSKAFLDWDVSWEFVRMGELGGAAWRCTFTPRTCDGRASDEVLYVAAANAKQGENL